MLYSAEARIVAVFTTAAINAKITTLNTALGSSATAVASVVDGWTNAPKDAASFPALVYLVGDGAGAGELARFGKRDTLVPVRLLYVSKHATLATAKVDIQVAMEALQGLLETLPGTQHGSTGRYVVDVLDPVVEFLRYDVDGEVVRQGGELRCALLMRTEGV